MKSKFVARAAAFACLIVALAASTSVAALERAGTVIKLKGESNRMQGDSAGGLSEGSPVYAGDTVKTGADARLLIRFSDASTLQMGADAEMVLDEMVYNVHGLTEDSDQQAVKFVEGVFKYISGTIAANSYTDVAITTPVATIGIRGTEFVAGRLTVGMSPGTSHYGYQIREGAIEIVAPGGSVTLDAPGEGTFLPYDRIAAPTPVRQWTPEEAQEADDLLAF